MQADRTNQRLNIHGKLLTGAAWMAMLIAANLWGSTPLRAAMYNVSDEASADAALAQIATVSDPTAGG